MGSESKIDKRMKGVVAANRWLSRKRGIGLHKRELLLFVRQHGQEEQDIIHKLFVSVAKPPPTRPLIRL